MKEAARAKAFAAFFYVVRQSESMHDMKRAIRISIVAALAVTLQADDQARIYVYARRDTAARSWMSISCGSAVVAEIKQGTFFAITLQPGQYTFLGERGVPLSVDTHSGEELFLRLDFNYGVGRPPIPVLSKVRRGEARKEMKYLSYINPKRVHSGLVPKTDPSPSVQPELRRREPR
jgi:hypothetical protein